MIELKCQNCGSHDVDYRGKYLVCRACGARFLLEQSERAALSKMERYNVQQDINRAMDLMAYDYPHWNNDRALKYALRAYTADENNVDAIYCYAKAIVYYELFSHDLSKLLLELQERALDLAAEISEKKYNEMDEKFAILRYKTSRVWGEYGREFVDSRGIEEISARIEERAKEGDKYWWEII